MLYNEWFADGCCISAELAQAERRPLRHPLHGGHPGRHVFGSVELEVERHGRGWRGRGIGALDRPVDTPIVIVAQGLARAHQTPHLC